MSSAQSPSIPQVPGEAAAGPSGRRASASVSASKLDPALRAEVSDEQLNMVLGHTRLGTLVATAFAVFLALQLRGVAVPAWLVDGWLVVKLGVAAARIYISVRYDRLGRPGRPSAGAAPPTPGCWPTASSGARRASC